MCGNHHPLSEHYDFSGTEPPLSFPMMYNKIPDFSKNYKGNSLNARSLMCWILAIHIQYTFLSPLKQILQNTLN